jgi:hypothetical protein
VVQLWNKNRLFTPYFDRQYLQRTFSKSTKKINTLCLYGAYFEQRAHSILGIDRFLSFLFIHIVSGALTFFDLVGSPDGSPTDNHFEKIVGFPNKQRYHESPKFRTGCIFSGCKRFGTVGNRWGTVETGGDWFRLVWCGNRRGLGEPVGLGGLETKKDVLD